MASFTGKQEAAGCSGGAAKPITEDAISAHRKPVLTRPTFLCDFFRIRKLGKCFNMHALRARSQAATTFFRPGTLSGEGYTLSNHAMIPNAIPEGLTFDDVLLVP